MIIFTMFHKDRRKIEDFLPIAKFWARDLFCTPSNFKNLSTGLERMHTVLKYSARARTCVFRYNKKKSNNIGPLSYELAPTPPPLPLPPYVFCLQ